MIIKNLIYSLSQFYFDLKEKIKKFIKTLVFMTIKYLEQKILLLIINQVPTYYPQL
jgi:hypothetical protein